MTIQRCARMLFLLMVIAAAPSFAATCESLSTLKLPDTTITSAQQVAAGAFVSPGMPLPPALVKNIPAFCRVQATLKPAKDSDIKIEVWMPVTGWNGKYRGQGNGGFAGDISYSTLAIAVSAGYASASTDTGHSGTPLDASWAKDHPDKIVDFGWRAIHEMTVQAKAIIAAFYGAGPKKSYFSACSNGGRQGLMEAQRFPEDYDGIIAGAPANYWTKVFATFIWDMQAMQATPESYIGANKIPAIANAVNAACDADDGVKDGVLNDPRECRFNAKTLACKGGDSHSCLTAPQVEALQKIYAGPRDAKGKLLYPGFLPGGEAGGGGWNTWISLGPGKDWQTIFATGFFNNMISVKDPVDLKTIKIETAVELADEQQAKTFNADSPDLKAFQARGGKLIIYHGWSDAALPPQATVSYYETVASFPGLHTPEFMRLYMVPGMQHCTGGPGATSFGQFVPAGDPQHDISMALEQWVEKGLAPEKIIATKFINDQERSEGIKMTRPLCPYPTAAKYKGSGDANDAVNFECVEGTAPIQLINDPAIKPPRALHTPEPEYSRIARKHGIEGNVVLSAIIGVDGLAHDVEIVQSLEPSLDANAIEALKKWKFAPATRNGKPIALRMNLELNFRLHN
ncbi:MAG TPA: TonB family protein [Candidatus Angelobacter sp.]|nr:TonB family protein [Candidatus Angelobacter sp.]